MSKSTDAAVEEAAQWVVRLSGPEVSLADRREFVTWLKRSPVHLGEYLRVEGTWADLAEVDPARWHGLAEILNADDHAVVELPVSARPGRANPDRVAGERGLPARTGLLRASAFAASVALAFTVSWLWLGYFSDGYSTAVGEQWTVKLDDGSTVVLNTNTRLQVAFSDSLREVRLPRGEALFKVAKDASRPFRVVSDRAVVQAVGTSFIVRRQPGQTVVTVIEGEVDVAHAAGGESFSPGPAGQGGQQRLRVRAGARASVADDAIRMSEIENPRSVAAWRSGRLIFEGETLAEVVAEFNRYNEVHLTLEDPLLSRKQMSGVFDADRPEALVRFLEHSGVIQPAQISGGVIVLEPRR